MRKRQGPAASLRALVRPPAVRGLRALLQRTAFVVELHTDLEMGNHAAAGALAFLLSAVPVLLLSFGLAATVLQNHPESTAEFQTTVAGFLGPVNLPDATPELFGQGFFALGTLAAIAGLLFASRLFFSSIRRTLKVLWGSPPTPVTWVDTLVGTLVELAALVTLVLVLALSEASRSLVYANQDELAPEVFSVMAFVVDLVPFVALWTFFVVTLQVFTSRRPSLVRTAWYSLVAVTAFMAVVQTLRLVLNTDQYELLYGVIANLVVVLLNVSAFFTLYFVTAAFLFVEQNFDALLFGRYHRHWGRPRPFPDSILFARVRRLDDLYGRTYQAGDQVFHRGDPAASAFFIEEGEVEIVLGEAVLDVLGPGQVFGETGALLGEPRSASARAATDLRVLELPAGVFAFYLQSDQGASHRIIGTLADRLKKANARSVSDP